MSQHQCLGHTAQGSRCLRMIPISDKYCWQHRDQAGSATKPTSATHTHTNQNGTGPGTTSSSHAQNVARDYKHIIEQAEHHDQLRFYGDHKQGTAVVDEHGLDCIRFTAGTYIFRGGKDGPEPRVKPAYYSDINVAQVYGRHPGAQCLGFALKRDVTLIRLDHVDNLKLLTESKMDPEDKEALGVLTGYGVTELNRKYVHCSYTNKNPRKLLICTEGYLNSQYKEMGLYISLQVALALRKLGFDGWFIPPEKMSRAPRKGEPFIRLYPFHTELLITQPSVVLKASDKSCTDVLYRR